MKYSNWIGTAAAILLIICCFQPWIEIESKNIVMTGMNKAVPNYGKPGLFLIVLSIGAISFYLIPKVWAKRCNLFVCALIVAWSIRNIIILYSCEYGDCPVMKIWIYGCLLLSIIMFIASLLPDLKVKSS